MSALSDALLENPNIAAQWRGKKKNKRVPEFIDDARKFIVGETPGEMAFNLATIGGSLPVRLGAGGLSMLLASDDANAGMIGRAGSAAKNKIASIIDDVTRELAKDNDKAERASELAKMLTRVNEDAAKLQKIHGGIFPNGTWSDSDRIHKKLAELRRQEQIGAGTKTGLAAAGGLGMATASEDAEAGGVNKVAQELMKIIKRSTELPNLRDMPTDKAIEIARKQPHLIKAGDQSEGYYVGGPRDIKSKRGLTNARKRGDEYIAADPRGGDWYDRYRDSVRTVTGNNPKDMDWMAKQEGQWSAGVDPGSEFQFAIRENNGSLAGMPVKSARPAQHEAHLNAIKENDPSLYQLGEKTGEYADLINPNFDHNKATGVNDFRNARFRGYTEVDGEMQRAGLTSAQHNFLDYENALAVDRANKAKLGGRDNWTGPQIQAAPWVRQKALDLMQSEKGHTYETAFNKANRQIGDWFDKHTAFATHEAQPGATTGHLPRSVGANELERALYAQDPRSGWATAPGGRDAIYSGLRLGDTGVAMRVRPSQEMTGMYTSPGGALEQNLGGVGRPLVAFDVAEDGTKSIAKADRSILEAGETLRAALDAQDMGGAHKVWTSGPAGKMNGLSVALTGAGRKATPEELRKAADIGGKYGVGDVVDTGQGLTLTNFGGGSVVKAKSHKAMANELAAAGYGRADRVKVDAITADLTDKWSQGVGSGAVTREVLGKMNVTPEMRNAFDKNPLLAQKALGNIERDAEWAAKWGATREDITNFRKIIGDGPGWIGRLESALKSGAVLPALGAAVLTRAMLGESSEQQ